MSRSAVRYGACSLAVLCAGVFVAVPAVAAETVPYNRFVTVAGTGENGYSGDGQRATDARIGSDGGIAVGPDGAVYIADTWGNRVRAVSGDGLIDTVPGTRALRSPENDGPEVNGFQHSPTNRPKVVAVAPDGALYIAGSETVWRRGTDGSATTLADVEATRISDPTDIALDGGGNVYVSGYDKIVKIDPAGTVTTIAGGGPLDPMAANGKPATQAHLSGYFIRIAATAQGAVYLVAPRDSYSPPASSTLHRIDPDGTLHTVAGGGETGFSGDGGPAAEARLSGHLGGVAVGADGTVYFFDEGNRLVRAIDAKGVITSISPSAPAGDAVGVNPTDVAVGPHDDIYVKVGSRVHRLVRDERKPAPARAPSYPSRFPDDDPGTVHTIAGSGDTEKPRESSPTTRDEDERLRIAVGPDGARYYSDAVRHRVMKVAADGASSILAGTGAKGFSGDGGKAMRAALNTPTGVDVGPDGSVYIADAGNERVRKVDPDGVITTVAGNGVRGARSGVWGEIVTPQGDGGPATAATVTPADVAVGADGSLYIAEDDNMRLSRVDPNGVISTFAGLGARGQEEADGHPATEASFAEPTAVATGPDGRVYLLDQRRTTRPAVRMIDQAGIVHTVAGNSYRTTFEAGFGGDGGPATQAELNNPSDIATGPDGTLYIADTYNARVRAVDPAGTITTIAGTGRRADSGDGGPATKAALNEPQTIAVGTDGVAHVINLPGDRIREISRGTVSTAGTIVPPEQSRDADTPATRTAVEALGIAIGRNGGLIIAHRTGLSTVADNGRLAELFTDHPELASAEAVAVGPDGSCYVEDSGVVYRVPVNGAPEPVAGGGPADNQTDDRVEPGQPATLAAFRRVVDLAVSPAGRLYVATADAVYRLADDDTLTVAYHTKRTAPTGIAVDAKERLYVAVSEENHVYRVADGKQAVIAGTGSAQITDEIGDGGDATEAIVHSPRDVAVDNSGNVYFGTYDGIRRVDADGTITTVTPEDRDSGSIGALVLDAHDDLYFVDTADNQVKVLVQPGQLANPIPWAVVIWLAVGALALAGAGWFFLRRHRVLGAEPEPATDEKSPEPPTPDDEESPTPPAADEESPESPAADDEPAADGTSQPGKEVAE